MTVLVLGLQTALCSLLLSILGLPVGTPDGRDLRSSSDATTWREPRSIAWIQDWRIASAVRFVPPGSRVLDVGCHDGALFRRLGPGAAGGDRPRPRARRGRSQATATGSCPASFPADAPDEPASFDAITMLAVLEHVPPDRAAGPGRRPFDLLRPGGRLILTVPSPPVDTHPRRADPAAPPARHGGRAALRLPARTTSSRCSARRPACALVEHATFQARLNNLFVFERPLTPDRGLTVQRPVVHCRAPPGRFGPWSTDEPDVPAVRWPAACSARRTRPRSSSGWRWPRARSSSSTTSSPSSGRCPAGEQVRIYGVVAQVRARHEGARFDSDVFLIEEGVLPAEVSESAQVLATRFEPEVFVPPLPGHAGAAGRRAPSATRRCSSTGWSGASRPASPATTSRST